MLTALYWIPLLYLFLFLGLSGSNVLYACLFASIPYLAIAIIFREITKDMDDD